MDALKLIAQDSLKAEAPKLNVGDTVKATSSVSRYSRVQLSPRSTAA